MNELIERLAQQHAEMLELNAHLVHMQHETKSVQARVQNVLHNINAIFAEIVELEEEQKWNKN